MSTACQNCGVTVAASAKYCPNCGTAVTETAEDASETEGALGAEDPSPTAGASATETEDQSRTFQSLVEDAFDPVVGAVGGVAAYLTAFVFTGLLVYVEVSSQSGDTGGSIGNLFDAYDVLTPIGWIFHGAHNVAVGSNGETVNFLETIYQVFQVPGVSATIPKFVYYLIPLVVLLVAGYIVARRQYPDEMEPEEGAIAGASIVVGYLVLSVIGALVVFTYSSQGTTVAPQLGETVLVMGIGYPVIVGSLGGVIAASS